MGVDDVDVAGFGVGLQRVVHDRHRPITGVVAGLAADHLDVRRVVRQPGDELVVAIGGDRRPERALDLEHRAALSTQDRVGDVLGCGSGDELVVRTDVLRDRDLDRSVHGDDRDAGVERALRGRRQLGRRERGEQEDVDALRDEVIDIIALLAGRTVSVGDDDLRVRHELAADALHDIGLMAAPDVAVLALREADLQIRAVGQPLRRDGRWCHQHQPQQHDEIDS